MLFRAYILVQLMRFHVCSCNHMHWGEPCFGLICRLGLGTEFRSEKIPRNSLGMVSVIPRKKALIPRHSEFRGRANSEARNGAEQP
jgi:hypothetical protein